MAILDTPQPDLSLEELRFLVTVAKTKKSHDRRFAVRHQHGGRFPKTFTSARSL